MEPLAKSRLKTIASLQKRKHRLRTGLSFVEGVRSVQSALDTSRAVEVVVARSALASKLVGELIAASQVPAFVVDDRAFGRMSDVKAAQGVLATVERRPSETPDLLKCNSAVVLDGVQDPGNVGTIVRTSAWFGIDAVVGGPETADFYNPKTLRASMGGLWEVKHQKVVDVSAIVGAMASAGREVVVADARGDVPIYKWKPRSDIVVVVGNEAYGVRSIVGDVSVTRVSIPSGDRGARGVESLNVAVALGILLARWREAAFRSRGAGS